MSNIRLQFYGFLHEFFEKDKKGLSLPAQYATGLNYIESGPGAPFYFFIWFFGSYYKTAQLQRSKKHGQELFVAFFKQLPHLLHDNRVVVFTLQEDSLTYHLKYVKGGKSAQTDHLILLEADHIITLQTDHTITLEVDHMRKA